MKESTQNNMMKPFFTNKSQININEAIIEKGNKATDESRKQLEIFNEYEFREWSYKVKNFSGNQEKKDFNEHSVLSNFIQYPFVRMLTNAKSLGKIEKQQ